MGWILGNWSAVTSETSKHVRPAADALSWDHIGTITTTSSTPTTNKSSCTNRCTTCRSNTSGTTYDLWEFGPNLRQDSFFAVLHRFRYEMRFISVAFQDATWMLCATGYKAFIRFTSIPHHQQPRFGRFGSEMWKLFQQGRLKLMFLIICVTMANEAAKSLQDHVRSRLFPCDIKNRSSHFFMFFSAFDVPLKQVLALAYRQSFVSLLKVCTWA